MVVCQHNSSNMRSALMMFHLADTKIWKQTNKIVKMAVENIIVFFVYIQSTLGIFNPQLLYYNPTYSSPGSQFQVGSKFIIHLKCLSLLFSSSFCKTFCKISNFKFSLVLESVCRCVWVYAGVHGCVLFALGCVQMWVVVLE